jgi:hypothetical protein
LDSKCETAAGGESTGAGRSLVEDFRILLEDMAEFARLHGVVVKPYQTAEIPLYTALPQRQKLAVYKGLRAYYETMVASHASTSVLSVPKSAGIMLAKLGLTYDADFLSTLTNEHVLEIYMSESLQVFRNLHFFTLTHYALEDICTRPWFELWERESRVTKILLEMVGQITDFKITGAISIVMPAHEVRDQASRLKSGAILGPMTLVPLFDKQGAAYGYMTSYQVSLVR